ncbi:hypothetical protein B7463_g11587, partial [Scytalidium lignicola]
MDPIGGFSDQLNTAVFAYESVLKQLKEIQEPALEDDILHWKRGNKLSTPSYQVSKELRNIPYSTEKILVVCYVHHALDQFLEDLLELGIPEVGMVRLGSTTKMLNLQRIRDREESQNLQEAFRAFRETNSRKSDLVEQLEFQMDGTPFLGAFCLPEDEDGMVRVDKKDKAANEFYLFDRWCRGEDANIGSRLRRRAEDSHTNQTLRAGTLRSPKEDIKLDGQTSNINDRNKTEGN